AVPRGAVNPRAGEGRGPAAFDLPRVWVGGHPGRTELRFRLFRPETAVLRKLEELVPGYEPDMELPPGVPVADLAASFQAAVVDVLVGKTVRAAEEYGATEIFVAGGVSANAALRAEMIRQAGRPVRVPPLSLCTDNAAMIAAAGYFRYMRGQRDTLDFDVLPTWPLAVEPPPNQAATQAGEGEGSDLPLPSPLGDGSREVGVRDAPPVPALHPAPS